MAEVELSDPIGALRGDLRKRGDLYARCYVASVLFRRSRVEAVRNSERCGKRLARGTAGSLREGMVKS